MKVPVFHRTEVGFGNERRHHGTHAKAEVVELKHGRRLGGPNRHDPDVGACREEISCMKWLIKSNYIIFDNLTLSSCLTNFDETDDHPCEGVVDVAPEETRGYGRHDECNSTNDHTCENDDL